MFDKECIPYAPSLIESMRSLGYSFSSAIADLIDNSISANAKRIDIISTPGSDPSLLILDNGVGMTDERLYEAMRYGSSNPLEKRDENDLGRFGLGLKSASLSQCRKLVVISKQRKNINGYAWDLDYVVERGKWILKGYSEDEINKIEYIDKLTKLSHGTFVLLQDFDRVKESTSNMQETFSKYLDDMIDHLSLVFHRYIEDGLKIYVNGTKIAAKDPFLKNHKATQTKRETPVYINNEKISVKPYILPHLSKLSKKDVEKIGGKGKLRTEQGFYVYRNKRLIIWGTWFRLERKDELNKLARVQVDIPNSLDYMWSIDVKKSTAILPDIIKKNLYNAVFEAVSASEHVHSYRGRKEKKDSDIDFVWERIRLRDGYEYAINREIPQVKALVETLGSDQLKMFDSLIRTIEESFPVAALYLDAAKGNIEEKTKEEDEAEQKLWAELQIQVEYIRKNNLPLKQYYEAFLKVEPYCNNKGVKNRIAEEIAKYE